MTLTIITHRISLSSDVVQIPASHILTYSQPEYIFDEACVGYRIEKGEPPDRTRREYHGELTKRRPYC